MSTVPPAATTSHGGCLRSPDCTFAIRVDASNEIGTGHFMRCLALADALRQRGGIVQFICRRIPAHMRELAYNKGHTVASLALALCSGDEKLTNSHWPSTSQQTDAELTIDVLSRKHVRWLIVDHYALDLRWESALRPYATNIMVVDDLADRVHDCDILLDQNLYDDMPGRYKTKVPSHCRLLLGPKYALLRDEFIGARASLRHRDGTVRRILILMGGVDVENLTSKAIDAVSRLGLPLSVDVVIGAQHFAQEQIATACYKLGYALHLQPSNIAELMDRADLAIGAGGSTTWERCCLGLPTLTICVAENQQQLVEDAALNGLIYAPGLSWENTDSLLLQLRSLLNNPLLLRAMSGKGLQSVDGRGTHRVSRMLGCGTVTVREATLSDSGLVLTWRNHSDVRGVSGNTAVIDRVTHDKWFASALADPNRLVLLGEHRGERVGVARFDIQSGKAEVSIYLSPSVIGAGLGTQLLDAAESWLVAHRQDVQVLQARVLLDNQRSHWLFAECGYRQDAALYSKDIGEK